LMTAEIGGGVVASKRIDGGIGPSMPLGRGTRERGRGETVPRQKRPSALPPGAAYTTSGSWTSTRRTSDGKYPTSRRRRSWAAATRTSGTSTSKRPTSDRRRRRVPQVRRGTTNPDDDDDDGPASSTGCCPDEVRERVIGVRRSSGWWTTTSKKSARMPDRSYLPVEGGGCRASGYASFCFVAHCGSGEGCRSHACPSTPVHGRLFHTIFDAGKLQRHN